MAEVGDCVTALVFLGGVGEAHVLFHDGDVFLEGVGLVDSVIFGIIRMYLFFWRLGRGHLGGWVDFAIGL